MAQLSQDEILNTGDPENEPHIPSIRQNMSKANESFFQSKLTPSNLAKVATTKKFTPGRRVAPVDKREDADAQLRIAAGEKVGDKQNFVLQVNSQATNTALKKFVAQNGRGTHGKLATASFDTKAPDPEAEAERMVEEMKEEAKSKLG
ncbi:hypothetical protein LTR78_004093 [Recurvomyces mirabilis]|uniref:Uncharacterized protein n=1 Tax=Recurvomyces mirabilis TaxID=574656 RepID=A0AAE0WQC4_9PEZI|nr:hypothetical protein LTR78_004093 [Recurvomyces mirabilis]KAK5153734.1 hypothetical protein LTS14_007428 [Recurvomyces mirabilis]